MKNILIDVEVNKEMFGRLKGMPGVNVKTIEISEDERYISPDTVRDVNYLFCSVPCTNFKDMEALEFIQIASAGYSQLFGLDLPAKNIAASNARGVFEVPIAEWCVSMMVNLARDLRGMVRNQESSVWDRSAKFQTEIRGSLVGIWGYGAIGRETARLCNAMGMRVYAMDRAEGVGTQNPNVYRIEGTGDPEARIPEKIFIPGQEKEFLSDLDFLILSMPLTNKTKGMVGDAEFALMKPSSYLLNPARGPLIDENSLIKTLREGKIAGAAIDTHFYYPMPADHPLWRFPNVIMTPHISGSSLSPHFTYRVWDIFVQNVERLMSGRPVLNRLSDGELNGE